ncbi:MAG: Signal transduction histidine kinase [Mucilaginibacter sp.]|uniref:sensor histidine kinase n=1 Tax=Mucilaginibacter sp. TaxID=1882438 RepID=UPI0026274E1F|nr:HAMP domain-containing sensor histidine kinase [Mucilaginibacter sp.]MDB5004152.1 Signal transduction histidine kinase [Mucilaginibacter sp.]
MTVYFFTRINQASRAAFRSYCTRQNLRTVKTISLIYFLINLSIRILGTFTNLPFNNINHADELSRANMISTLISPLFYFAAVLLLNYYERNRLLTKLGHVLVILFAMFVITNGMRVTFFAMHNPRNTLVMYLAALMLAGVFFTIEYYETLIIAVVTSVIFMLVIPTYQPDFSEQLLNNVVSFVLLILYFCISRYLFSYRADNYLKLKAIEEKNIEIETGSRLKNEILGIVAHDLRNPLTAIYTLAMMMKDDSTINAENQENLQMIKASCDKATSIINDLIETAHNDKENVFDIVEVELNQYLLKIVDEWVKNKTDHTNILYYGTDTPIYTHINMEKMQRVMDNLISNAIKFSGESERVEVKLHNADGQIFIDVKDFGMGIPDRLLPYIFDRFSRASRRGIRGEESVGLGLSIVKQIVEKHGGNISVTSAEKLGTTFTIHMTPVRSNTKARQ